MAIPVIVDLLGAALVLALVLLALQVRGRRGLQQQARAASAATALAQSRLEDQNRLLAGLETGAREQQERLLQVTGERERLQALLESQREELRQERSAAEQRLAAQRTWIEEQTRFFEEKIASTANRLLEEKSAAFTEVNRKSIDAVVAPFKEQLSEFRQRVDHIYSSDSKDRSQLHEQIRQLTQLNQSVSRAAEGLTHALTVSSKATGDWGETILRKILEDSGLREGREYKLQVSITGSDGDRQQPDAVIYLPEDRQVIVDSKVSNKAWKEYCDAPDDAMRALRLKAHLASLRAHIKGLAERDYARSPDLKTVDYVLMFVPVEAALLTALSSDDSLYGDAYRNKIILVTPSTLMAVTKLIEGLWTFQRRKESADHIAEAGRKLYEKLTTFAASFVELGTAIEKTKATFERAQGQLSTGKGNAIRLAESMKELGVAPTANKTFPPSWSKAKRIRSRKWRTA